MAEQHSYEFDLIVKIDGVRPADEPIGKFGPYDAEHADEAMITLIRSLPGECVKSWRATASQMPDGPDKSALMEQIQLAQLLDRVMDASLTG